MLLGSGKSERVMAADEGQREVSGPKGWIYDEGTLKLFWKRTLAGASK